MISTSKSLRCLDLSVGMVLSLSLVLNAICLSDATAYETDAAQLKLQQRNGNEWSAEDAQIDERLAKLRNNTGKSPNIIFILSDDIG